ncbi:MAG: ammonium transporter Amt family [Planctomycetota bacterium]|nr:MAG: ammonium transporter Amt family [Planctomycetota bacterium]
MLRRLLPLMALGLLLSFGTARGFAQEEKAAAEKAAPAEAAAPTAAPEAAAPAVAPAPELPPYFTGTNPPAPAPAIWPDAGGGAAGYWTTPSAGPVGDGDPKAMTPDKLYDRIAHNTFSINMVWVLIAGFLVMFMQAGFAMVETGLCRSKNAAHTVTMNMMIYPLGCIAFWAYGFAIGWGNWFNGPVAPGWYSSLGPGTSILNSGIGIGETAPGSGIFAYGLMGTKGFFLNGMDDVSVMALFFFMMVFMDTTATIPTGSMCERWAWKNFVLYGLWVALPYCLFANWVWGGGWLANLGSTMGFGHGAVDFAGSGVVHAMGGAIALAGAIVIGPRIGKFVDGKPVAIPGHHVPMVVIGTFILAFGWFGFNPGSTLSGTDLRISAVVVNTMLAGISGAIATMFYMMAKGMKPDPSMMCNGMLAGLVAITAPCAFVDSWAAVVIGAIAGVLVVESVFFWERRGVDDPVGAISVHGVNGTWGVISLGIFANGKYGMGWNNVVRTAYDSNLAEDGVLTDGVRGLLYGDVSQLWAQLIDAGVVWVFGFTMAYVWFKLSDKITPLRVSREIEIEGLDVPEMGAHAYPDFVANR